MGEILTKGLLDTAFGMGIVFVLLIFLAIIIWALKFIPMLVDSFKKKEETNTAVRQAVDTTISQIEASEQENLIGDAQLVAVITAAIMASMGDNVPADGFVVRSIKKANKATWIRA
ncbi:sodium pump decarboxylase gamma subunit [Mobilisporobacter senegalensis]|uniref:Sodium pump decarboxylase gamma subunit n=1 Tax=Mobilisporobacter senegalensis TaxID=1329262 RepID=A0A3N1XT35_9FIRM|nr:OadG family protein [Mobilisporobacter senegalensis]ROR29408.1 sodium pump decarboxylase gamma subunit [Mobilisporobacter senegalensis]